MSFDTSSGVGVTVSEIEQENIRRIFQQFDADNSNTIDLAELKEVMASLGVLMDEHHLFELVEQIAQEGSKELNFNEFISLITLWKEASQYKLFDTKGFKSLAQRHVEDALRTKSFVPDHPARVAWDVLIAFAALALWIWVLLIDAYEHSFFNATGLIVGDAFITVLLILDAMLSAQTCFTDSMGKLEDNPSRVRRHYLVTWMIPDVLSAIPFDLILTLAGATTAATVLRHCRLFKILKVPWLWQASGRIPITSNYIQVHFHILPIFQLLLTFVFMVHGFAIGWVLLKQREMTDTQYLEGGHYPYTPAVYFVLYTLSTVGLGDISVDGEAQQWYASAVLCGAMVTNGIVIGKLVAILQRADIKKERRSKLRETLAVLDHFSIPKQLQEEILQFQAHVFEHNLGEAYEGIVSGLPAEMKTNISLFVKMRLVSSVPIFMSSHYMLRIAAAQNLDNAVARPEQYIVVCGQETDGLYFLAYGFADVCTSDGSYDGTLRSGDFFGDTALLTKGEQCSSVKAITYCDLWVLSRQSFNTLLKRFPKFKRSVDVFVEELDQIVKDPHESSTKSNPLESVQSFRPAKRGSRALDDNERALLRGGSEMSEYQQQSRKSVAFDKQYVEMRKKDSVGKLKSLLSKVQSNKKKLEKMLEGTPAPPSTAAKPNRTA